MENKTNCPKCNSEVTFSGATGKKSIELNCPDCQKVFKIAQCPHCTSSNVYGISRVVGYYSKINNWNKSKTAEFKDRQKGDYKC